MVSPPRYLPFSFIILAMSQILAIWAFAPPSHQYDGVKSLPSRLSIASSSFTANSKTPTFTLRLASSPNDNDDDDDDEDLPGTSPWETKEELSQYATEETLLKMHCRINTGYSRQEALGRVQKYLQSFPYAAVLPVQPMSYLPAYGDGGVELKFLRKKTQEKGSVDGGLRMFIGIRELDGDIEIVVKRNSEGQTVTKQFSEKLLVQALVKGFSGNDDTGRLGKHPPTKDVVTIASVFHKWMDGAILGLF